jgi:COMPASS component SWD3
MPREQADVTMGESAAEGAPNFQLRHSLEGHARAVSSARFSPSSGDLIASTSADDTAKLWRSSDGTLLRTLAGHERGLSDACWSPGGQYLCTASDDRTLRLWDVETGKCLRTLRGHTNYVMCCTWHPDGHMLVGAQGLDRAAGCLA